MRNRLSEISAVLAGIAIVVTIYLYRDGAGSDVQQAGPQPAVEQPRPATMPPPSAQPAVPPSPAVSSVPITERALPAVDEAELQSARVVWQSAVAEVEAVEAELEVLDVRFDAKEAELAEMESQGMEPDRLEEEMLIFLDGIVDEYDALESRLAEAEAIEADAAERLGELTGVNPR